MRGLNLMIMAKTTIKNIAIKNKIFLVFIDTEVLIRSRKFLSEAPILAIISHKIEFDLIILIIKF